MKLSIITVVLDKKYEVEDCINSVLNQTYKDVEYIIVDGGSTDGTVDIIRQYEKKISVWISKPDHGLYDAMNKGIEIASGDVVGFLNADDVYFDDNVLENIASVMNNSNTDACYSDLVYVDNNNLNKIVRYWRSYEFQTGLFKKGWVPAHPTFFVRKNIYDQYGTFDLSYKLAADYELMARFLEYYKIRVKYVPKVSVKMRVGGATNKSPSNIVRQNLEIFKACKKNNIKIFYPLFLTNKFINRVHQFYLKP
jgi:glycosyltransferase involved in cell wall biosynthesis